MVGSRNLVEAGLRAFYNFDKRCGRDIVSRSVLQGLHLIWGKQPRQRESFEIKHTLFSELSMVSVRMRGMMLFTSTHEPSSNAPDVEDNDGAVVKAVVLLLFGHALPLSQ